MGVSVSHFSTQEGKAHNRLFGERQRVCFTFDLFQLFVLKMPDHILQLAGPDVVYVNYITGI